MMKSMDYMMVEVFNVTCFVLTIASYVKEATGYEPKVITGNADKGIHLSIASDIRNPEGYRLLVSENGIEIAGASNAGIFYGVQTLRKSIPAVAEGMDIELPAASINDYPRFPYRGMHLDVSRHFFPVDSVKKFIDILALHNMNRFHWHLTDDQGWRIEIKKYPELTQIVVPVSASYQGQAVAAHTALHGAPDGRQGMAVDRVLSLRTPGRLIPLPLPSRRGGDSR